MKFSTIIGFLMIAIGVTAYFFADTTFGDLVLDKEFLIGTLFGTGFGFLIGGFLGWLYKKSPVSKKDATVVEEPKKDIY